MKSWVRYLLDYLIVLAIRQTELSTFSLRCTSLTLIWVVVVVLRHHFKTINSRKGYFIIVCRTLRFNQSTKLDLFMWGSSWVRLDKRGRSHLENHSYLNEDQFRCIVSTPEWLSRYVFKKWSIYYDINNLRANLMNFEMSLNILGAIFMECNIWTPKTLCLMWIIVLVSFRKASHIEFFLKPNYRQILWSLKPQWPVIKAFMIPMLDLFKLIRYFLHFLSGCRLKS